MLERQHSLPRHSSDKQLLGDCGPSDLAQSSRLQDLMLACPKYVQSMDQPVQTSTQRC